MRRLRWPALAVAVCITSVAATGCWDRVEVKDLALVMATGIDRAPTGSGVQVTSQIAIPSGVGGGQTMGGGSGGGGELGKSFFLETATGQNIQDALQRLQEKLPRRLYNAHRRVILIGEDMARQGIGGVLDFFGRDPMNRLRVYLLVTRGMRAADAMSISTHLESIPGQEIKKLEDQDVGMRVTFREFLIMAASEGRDPVAGALERYKEPGSPGGGEAGAGGAGGAGSGGSGSGGGGSSSGERVSLSSTAVFRDMRLVGYLDDDETRGAMWVMGKIKNAYVTAYVPEGHGTVSLFITSAKRRTTVSVKGGRPAISVELKGSGEIVENDTNLDLDDTNNLKIVKRRLENAVRQRVLRAVAKAQKDFHADIFGWGQLLYETHPRLWKQIKPRWREMYPEVTVEVTTNILPLRPGTSGPPLQLEASEVKRST
ncbi:MAG: Ger(x)C family spore germination protein [Alicyclobacillus sp.]|nr:Ger(x)C family spore germination protein [Alicyclobacillus sp.]